MKTNEEPTMTREDQEICDSIVKTVREIYGFNTLASLNLAVADGHISASTRLKVVGYVAEKEHIEAMEREYWEYDGYVY
jgi:hypothetical protein